MKALNALLPPPPEHPAVELLRLLTVFSTETKSWIDGAEQHEGLIQIWKDASAGFKIDIYQTAPNFRPFKDAEEEQRLKMEVRPEYEADSGVRYAVAADEEEEQGMASQDEEYEQGMASEHESSDDSTKNLNKSSPVFLLDVRKDLRK